MHHVNSSSVLRKCYAFSPSQHEIAHSNPPILGESNYLDIPSRSIGARQHLPIASTVGIFNRASIGQSRES